MARIFPLFATLAVFLLLANFVAGLWIGDFNASAQRRVQTFNAYTQLKDRPTASTEAIETAKADLAAADADFSSPRQRMTLHMLLGSSAALAVVLVCSVAITYFIGVSRWCKEVVEAYHLPVSFAEQMAVLKRRTFRWSLVSISAVIALIASGAAADPSAMGAFYWDTAALVQPHFLMAMVGMAIVIGSFWMQWQIMQTNFAVLEEVMSGVRAARAARGLPTEANSAQ